MAVPARRLAAGVPTAGGGSDVATGAPPPNAFTGEQAARRGRPPESWEHVMPWNVGTAEQPRPVAALLGRPGGYR